MARPNLKFKDVEEPLTLRCGERCVLNMQIKPRAVGKCLLTIFLKAETVVFGGGSKEIVTEFEVEDIAEKRDVEIQLVMMGAKPLTYSLNLNAKVENADGDKNDDFVLVKLDCKKPMKEEEQTVYFDEEPLTEVETEADELPDEIESPKAREESIDTELVTEAEEILTDTEEKS